MIQRASYIGELAVHALARRDPGKVTRVFPNSVYLRTGDDFVLLLRGGLKSPMTINVLEGRDSLSALTVGEECKLDSTGVNSESVKINVGDAKVHHGSLLMRRQVVLPGAPDLAKGAAMLRSLYDVSAQGSRLTDDSTFRAFVKGTLSPFARTKSEAVYGFRNYLGLIGRGGGFTPAGDDFVSGFVGAFNYFARCRRRKTIAIPRGSVMARTVPESGAIVEYSARGYVDEGMERLILASSGGTGDGLFDALLAVASRGHTSGIEMSLGVLLCEAAVSDSESGGGALAGCLKSLSGR